MAKQNLPGLLIVLYFTCLEARSYIEDYCWRDYDGIIPRDAVAHGLDSRGKPVYAGQILFENKIIPGEINVNDESIHFQWGDKEVTGFKNVKILCSKNANHFRWISATSRDVVLLANKILINGGYEEGYSTYIGRKEVDGVSHIGKIICSTDDCGLYTAYDGNNFYDITFQILTYEDSNNTA